MTFHGVGTLLVCGDQTFMVCGYRFIEQNKGLLPCYVMVPYPLGYIDADSLSLVDATVERRVIASGHICEDGSNYICSLSNICSSKQELAFDDYMSAFAAARNVLLSDGGVDE